MTPRNYRLIPRQPSTCPEYESISDYYDNHDQAEWDQLSLQQYTVTAREYFNRAYKMYPRSFEDVSLLFYCAFELRCAIERVFYECLLHLSDEHLSKKASKLWAANDLRAALLETDPDFFWKVEFFNITAVARKEWRYVLPLKNMQRLLRDYGLLHPYLHAQKAGSNLLSSPLWWHTFRDLIESLQRYAWSYCAGFRLKITLDKLGTDLLENLKSGNIKRQHLIQMLREKPSFEMNIAFRQFTK